MADIIPEQETNLAAASPTTLSNRINLSSSCRYFPDKPKEA
jgi:hypothetical protein